MILDDIRKAIKTVYEDKPVLAQLCFAQAVLESNLDGKISGLASRYKNLFGIKDTDGKSKVDLPTTECNKNGCWKESQPFEAYQTFEGSILHHRRLMQKLRYIKVWDAKTLEEACHEVWKAGYATDPSYPAKLLKRYKGAGGL